MIIANFAAYGSYVTDSLYQWDKNQVLTVNGINIDRAPEVHFANAKMDAAIVRQAELNDGIISVMIPNSLLQTPYTIKAYIGIYEDDTFKTIEALLIPITPRERPYDYEIEDTDLEIHSFNELENRIANLEAQLSALTAASATAETGE